MYKFEDITLTFDDGSEGTMHFVLNPRIGPTEATAKVVWRDPTDENIQAEIDKSSFWDGRKVVSWKRKDNG